MIRIDAVWLAAEPLDMRAGTDTALSRVVQVFGSAKPYHAYLFANRRANRMKVLVHDGLGIWLCARRLHQGRFLWANIALGVQMALSREQLDALVLGLPWQRLPTLTGLADRAHLLSPNIDVHTHVQDVARLVEWEDLDSVVLVGHSYGGIVVTDATEVLGSRVRSLVYLDAFAPNAGDSLISMSPGAEDRLRTSAAASNGLSIPPYPAQAFGVTGADGVWVTAKMSMTEDAREGLASFSEKRSRFDWALKATYFKVRRRAERLRRWHVSHPAPLLCGRRQWRSPKLPPP